MRAETGTASERDNPNWAPLLDAIGEELTGDFMWMYEVELDSGKLLQVYKHVDTRRSIHLDDEGTAFVYEPSRYRQYPLADLFAAVFASLPGLAGVDEAQIRRSRQAVERLREAERAANR